MSETAEKTDALFRREQSAGVVTLTLQNSKSRNSLSLTMLDALYIEIARLKSDPSARAVVLAADGPAFSSGHDLKEILAHQNDRDKGEEFYAREMSRCSDLMLAITDLRKPVIAAIEGVATAAGCQLVATCDLAIAGEQARFALPGVAIGLFCSTPLVAVGRAISRKHAMEMALTGDLYSAADALRFGLVNRVVPAGEALRQAQALAASIAARSAATVALGKRTYYQQIDKPVGEAYALASQAMVDNLSLADAGEGISAFLEKRPPNWEDR
jgi:enoyl-CoA hydratase/carnithine racemase